MRIAVATLAGVIAVGLYLVFLHIPLCLHSVNMRIRLPSQLGICPPFVERSLNDLRTEFEEQVAVGDDANLIEAALLDLGVSFSWDKFTNRYQGIIRHPSSNFHAIVIHVYVDKERRYESIDIHDSFTTI